MGVHYESIMKAIGGEKNGRKDMGTVVGVHCFALKLFSWSWPTGTQRLDFSVNITGTSDNERKIL
jgi:hypothetical protein